MINPAIFNSIICISAFKEIVNNEIVLVTCKNIIVFNTAEVAIHSSSSWFSGTNNVFM